MFLALALACSPPLMKENVPEGEALPIDGVWKRYSSTINQIVTVEKGRMYVSEPVDPASQAGVKAGLIQALNIKQTGPKTFVCEWVHSHLSQHLTVSVEALSDTSIVFRIPAFGLGGTQYLPEEIFYTRVAAGGQAAGAPPAEEIKTRLDGELKRVEASSELIEIPPGVSIEIKRTRTIEHVVDIDLSGSTELNVSGDFLFTLKASVRAQIEAALRKSFKQSESLEHKISLDGNRARKYKLVWYDKLRTGTAEFKVNNKPASVPFQFREWEDLEVVALDAPGR